MKIRNFNSVILFLSFMAIISCKKDNYNPPNSILTGAILYNGDTLRFSNSNPLNLELWQTGFGKRTPINVFVNEAGKFSAVLFDGDYKLDLPSGNYPFVFPSDKGNDHDTISFRLDGSLNLNLDVTPYYILKDVSFSKDDRSISANFIINKIISDARSKNIDKVFLFLGKTRIVDNSNNISTASVLPKDITDYDNVNIKTTIPEMTPSQSYVFARVGLKIASIEQMIFSPVIKIEF